jgi:nucleoside-diphosphate-sugar epimerase
MKILITGNLGYVGSELGKTLKKAYPEATLIGYDCGFFARQITNAIISPDIHYDQQIYGDVRSFPEKHLAGVDTVVQLAAISNDPIGDKFEQVTMDINHKAVIDIAGMAKGQGVKSMVFASSCSVYGFAEETARAEISVLNPLTAYARSKVASERDLESLADDNFKVTCLRFATACGMSDRLRLDLVLNDFVAGAISSGEINILSDGSPWRPLINVRDMGRAIMWGHERDPKQGGSYSIVNAGSNEWNFRVIDLAYAIRELLPSVKISINKDAVPDKRSYKVNFNKFKSLAPHFQPQFSLRESVKDLIEGLDSINFNDKNFRQSRLIRLFVVSELLEKGLVDQSLRIKR